MRIYSEKFENIVLWEGPLPIGKALDVGATDRNIENLYEEYLTKLIGENSGGERTRHSWASGAAWDLVWAAHNADACYVWIEE